MASIRSIASLLAFLIQALGSLLIIYISQKLSDEIYVNKIILAVTLGGIVSMFDFGLKTVYQRILPSSEIWAKALKHIFVLIILLFLLITLLLKICFGVSFFNEISFIFRTLFYFKTIRFLVDQEIIYEKVLRILVVSLQVGVFFILLKFGAEDNALFYSNIVYLIFSFSVLGSRQNFSIKLCRRAFRKFKDSIKEYMINLFPAYFLLPLPIILLEKYMPVNAFHALGYIYNVFHGALAVSTIPTTALVAHYVRVNNKIVFMDMLKMNQRISSKLFLYVYIGGICFLRLINSEVDLDSTLLLSVGLLGIFESNQKVWMFSKIQNGIMGYPVYFLVSVCFQCIALLLLRTSHVFLAFVIAVLVQIVIVDVILLYKKSRLLLPFAYGYILLFILALNNNILLYLGIAIASISVFQLLRSFYENEYNNPRHFS